MSPVTPTKPRIALPNVVNKFIQTCPVIRIPDMQDNQQKMDCVKKPLQNGQKVLLPVSRNLIVNGYFPNGLDRKRKCKEPSDEESQKVSFLKSLNLVDTVTAEKNARERASVESEAASIEEGIGKKLRSRKGQVVTYFKNNPIPITSSLGKKIILVAGIGKCLNPTDEVLKLDKYCSLTKVRNIHSSATTWPEVNTRRKLKSKNQYVHTYAYGPRQRSKRKVELTIGLSERCYPLFNQCRDVSVSLYRMIDEDIARELAKLAESRQKSQKVNVNDVRTTPVYHWISSTPLPGPSRGLEIIRTPKIELYDIKHSPSKAKYFR